MKKTKNENNVYKFTTKIVLLLVGIILILVSVIFDTTFSSKIKLLMVVLTIISKCILAVGVALVVGFITSKIQNSEKTINKQKEKQSFELILRNEIISKDFISQLSTDKKNEIIQKCILSENTSEEMREYISSKFKDLKNISGNVIRSNIDYMTQVSVENNVVKAETSMSYRIYPNKGKFAPIRHQFDKETGKITSMKIITPKGKAIPIPNEILQTEETKRHCGNQIIYTNSVDIPNYLANENYLTIKIKVVEYGNDHWINLCWMSLYPTNIISYKVICDNGLKIKNHMVFDQQNNLYLVELNDSLTQFTISCGKWTDPYTGFSLVIGRK